MLFKFISTITLATTVAAHGYVKSITVDGKNYNGFAVESSMDPSYNPELIAWSTSASDQGFVADVQSPDIICHREAQPGAVSAEVAAGGTVSVTWSTWPQDHQGPVIDYLASCNGPCNNVDKTSLKFFKIDEAGRTSSTAPSGTAGSGTWATDELIANGATWDITIPANLKAGEYVLRHEIIALHSAGNPQPYPQCINLKVTGGGNTLPDGTPGMELYSGDEPGMTYNIWQDTEKKAYEIPGPKMFDASGSEEDAATSDPGNEPVKSEGTEPATSSTSSATAAPTTSTAPPVATQAPICTCTCSYGGAAVAALVV